MTHEYTSMKGLNKHRVGDGPAIPADTAAVLTHLREVRSATRTQLARQFDLSRPAIELRLTRLKALDLVAEDRVAVSTGGRPASTVRFAAERCRIIGVDLGATSLDVALTDLDGSPLVRRSVDIDVRQGPDAVQTTMCDLIDEVIAADHAARDLLVGIGVGLPGPVEFKTGRPIAPPIMPGWDGYPLGENLAEQYSVPVYVDNDVNVMARGECWAGRGAGVQHFLWVKIGSGIGCGIVVDGHVYRGAMGSAGDIGHVAVPGSQRVCRCGNVGCLESIAGGYALSEQALELALDGSSSTLAEALRRHGTVTVADLRSAVEQGDAKAVDLVRSAGHAIGEVLAAVVSFFNPEMVIIGGGVVGLGDGFLAAIRERVYSRSLPLATRDLSLATTTLGDSVGVIGAAALVLEELLQLAPRRDALVP